MTQGSKLKMVVQKPWLQILTERKPNEVKYISAKTILTSHNYLLKVTIEALEQGSKYVQS